MKRPRIKHEPKPIFSTTVSSSADAKIKSKTIYSPGDIARIQLEQLFNE